MATKIAMPQLGESVVDGTVGEWLKSVGEFVEEFEPIVRVSTDKVDTEIPSPASGVLLEIKIAEGETVDAGVVLGIIGAEDEVIQEDHTPAHTAENGHYERVHNRSADTGVRQARKASTQIGHVTPVVARMAEEHHLDLSQIVGTGRNGRIRKKDVLAYLDTNAKADIPPWEQPVDGDLFKPTVNYEEEVLTFSSKSQAVSAPPAPPKHREPIAIGASIPGELVALTNMRRMIANHMVESKLHTSPHVTTVMEVDLSAIVAHRQEHKQAYGKQGIKLTFTPYFVAACAIALQKVPELNARWTDEGLYLHHVAHIGMAVAIDDGLIVPVIKNAQDYNLKGLARQVNDLAERARTRQLQPDEIRDGTFTITNHGVSGSLMATPIINQPQAGILGIGMIEKRVKVVHDAIAIRPCVYLSLTFDHRVADGATADAFLMMIKQTLENWAE